MLTINTNLSSLIAQRSMQSATSLLNQAVERMTTGYKVNHAKDNAANYSIITNINTKIGAYQVAEENCAMNLDMLMTATESLDLIHDKLTRLRDLAEQARNGTYGEQSLKAINSEANALVDEAKRLYNTTNYNGIQLFSDEETIITPDETKRVSKQTSFTPGETYYITDYKDLVQLQDLVNAGNDSSGCYFELVEDINMNGISFEGIGTTAPFRGTFNGNGHSISNLAINNSSTYVGLFGRLAGNIKNVKMENCTIVGSSHVGILVGFQSSGTIESCSTSGSVSGTDRIGGLVGRSSGTISKCSSTATIDGERYIGGIAGHTEGTLIQHSFFNGNISCSNKSSGGIVGSANSSSTIKSCYSLGTFTGTEQSGGIAGYTSGGAVINCYSKATISGTRWVAGIVAYAENTAITSCYSLANVSGTSYVENILGYHNGSSTNDCASLADSNEAQINAKYTNNYMNMTTANGWETGGGNPTLTWNISNKKLPEIIEVRDLAKIYFTLGINGEDHNTIFYDRGFEINDIDDLKRIGLEESNFLEKADKILSSVSLKQTYIGSMQNRLESTLEEISVQYENLVSTRSTLRDADISEVSSQYIKQQILQQASATLMATANQSPSIALQLI